MPNPLPPILATVKLVSALHRILAGASGIVFILHGLFVFLRRRKTKHK